MSNKGLLIILAIIVVGIIGAVVIEEANESPAENISESVGNAAEDLGDGIEDAADEAQ